MTDTYGQLIARIERGVAAEHLYPLRDALAKRYADPTVRSPTGDSGRGGRPSTASTPRHSATSATTGR